MVKEDISRVVMDRPCPVCNSDDAMEINIDDIKTVICNGSLFVVKGKQSNCHIVRQRK